MPLEIFKISYPFQIAITKKLKSQLVSRLKAISPSTALGFALHDFSKEGSLKTDEEFKELLNDLSTELREGPFLMRKILGDNFGFFQELLS